MSIEQHNGNGNGNTDSGSKRPSSLSPLDTLPKVAAQIIINLHVGGRVTASMPTDMKASMYMLGEFFKQIGPSISFNPPSPIVTPPAGLVIPGAK